MIALDVAQEVEIPVERDVRIVPALHEDLDRAHLFRFVDLGADLFVGQRPPFAVFWATIECAEAAVGDADVGVIDVAIDDIRHDALGMLLATNAIGFGAELEERCVRVEIEYVLYLMHVTRPVERPATRWALCPRQRDAGKTRSVQQGADRTVRNRDRTGTRDT